VQEAVEMLGPLTMETQTPEAVAVEQKTMEMIAATAALELSLLECLTT
jgi:hypothetical protein